MLRRAPLAIVSLLTAACATGPPHPPTGMMWGYIGKLAHPPNQEIVGYAPDRPSCESSRATGQTRSGVPVPSSTSDRCQQLAVLPYQEGEDSVYWVFGPETDLELFGIGASDRNLCLTLREEALKVISRLNTLRECEPVIVKRVL
jgi:hypothetical protein